MTYDPKTDPLHQHVLKTLKADVAAMTKRSKAAKKAWKTRRAKPS